jgi:DNA helicase-2/ATP-dependent DNA helicase PcrA
MQDVTSISRVSETQTHTEYRTYGPPGTGKTTWAARQVRAAVDKYGPAGVMVASFTKAAAIEIAGRGLGIDEEKVGTLHSLAYRAIGRPAIALDGSLRKEWNERNPEFTLSGSGRGLDDPDAPEDGKKGQGDAILEHYDLLRSRLWPRATWPTSVLHFASLWEAFKDETGSVDFADMIEIALRECPTAPGRPIVGFFDEAQDFTALELALVRSWAASMEYVVLIGDDDQTLYAFRGATPEAFLEPQIPDEQKRVLGQSYRVPRRVHELAARWIERIPAGEREPKAYRPREYEGDVWRTQATYRAGDRAVDLVEKMLDSGRKVMVLGAAGYHLQPSIKELRRRGIPFHNPWAPKRGDWNPLARRKGTTAADRLLAFLRPDPDVWGEDAVDIWPAKDLKAWADLVRADLVLERGAKTEIGKSEVVTVNDLRRWFKPDAFAAATSLDVDWFERSLLADACRRMEFPLAVYRTRGATGLTSTPHVTVSTIHASKGAEADAVILFPDLSPAGYAEWSSERYARVVRQFYVAVTRARDVLAVCRAGGPWAVELEAA